MKSPQLYPPPERTASLVTSRSRWKVAVACSLLAALAEFANARVSTSAYAEINGTVAIDAERFTVRQGQWELVEGRTADYYRQGTTDSHRLLMVDAGHPLAAGLYGEVILPRPVQLHWALPPAGAEVVVALATDPGRAVVFAFERGATMPGGPAPERRVATVSLRQDSPPEIKRLFDASVRWAVAHRPNARRVLLVPDKLPMVPGEEAIASRLKELGFDVESIGGTHVTTEDALRHDLVFIPISVHTAKVLNKFNLSPIPVALAKPGLLPSLGLIDEPSPWDGQGNAVLLRDPRPGDRLRYAIHFSKTGAYRLQALGLGGGDVHTEAIEVAFGPAGETLPQLLTLVLPPRLGWTDRAYRQADGGHLEPVVPLLHVTAPGWHELQLLAGAPPTAPAPVERRRPNWLVDRVVLDRDLTGGLRVGDGPPATPATAGIPLPTTFADSGEWRPEQIWPIRHGWAVIEAEEIAHDPKWELRRQPEGFTGRGYLSWQGLGRGVSITGLRTTEDHFGIRQGPMETWLIVRLHVEEAGRYVVNVRNYHELQDGDNDAWLARVGHSPTPHDPILRFVGRPGFTWMGQGRIFEFEVGLVEFYVSGRSRGFGIDRIAVYREGDTAAEARALDVATPPRPPLLP
jgi:hypothetical protein